jgi:hypothetical protein
MAMRGEVLDGRGKALVVVPGGSGGGTRWSCPGAREHLKRV